MLSLVCRLHNPTECPYNGSRRDDCQCRKDYTAAGFSSFQKIRIDLGTMQIISKLGVSCGSAHLSSPRAAWRLGQVPRMPGGTRSPVLTLRVGLLPSVPAGWAPLGRCLHIGALRPGMTNGWRRWRHIEGAPCSGGVRAAPPKVTSELRP